MDEEETAKNTIFVQLLQAVTCYLLDGLLQEKKDEIPAETRTRLVSSFSRMKERSVDLKKLGESWDAKELANMIGTPVYQDYLKLLSEV